MAAGSGSGFSNNLQTVLERPVLVVRARAGGGFIVETYEVSGGMLMATVMSADSADHASRIARAALQDIEREADVRAAEGRGIASATAPVKERV